MNSVGIQLFEMSQNFSRIHLVPRSIFLRLDQATGAVLIMQIGGSLTRGLLCSIQTVESRKATHPEPRTKWPATRTLGLCLTNDLADVGRSNSKCFQVVFLVGPSRTPKSFDVGLTWFSLPITIANTSPDL